MQRRFFSLFRSENLSELAFPELRHRCIEGSEDARRELIARYEPLVWRTVAAHLGGIPQEDLEEVVANTFIALLANNAALLGRYNPTLGLSPEGYIRRQAILQGINRYRSLKTDKRRHEVPLEPNPESPGHDVHADTRPTPEQKLMDQHELKRLLDELLSNLSPALALTFEMLYVRELEPADVAEKLGCSMDVVYTRKKRLLRSLETLMVERRARQTGERR